MNTLNAPRTRAVLAASTLLLTALAATQADAAQAPAFAPRLRAEASRYDPLHQSWITIDVTQAPTERNVARMSFVVPQGYGLPKVNRGGRFAKATIGIGKSGKEALLPDLLLTGDLRAKKVIGNSCVAKPLAVYSGVLATDPGGRTKASMGLTVFLEKVGSEHRFTICLPSKAPTPGVIRRFGLEVVAGLFPPGPGRPVWRGIFTPYASSGAAAAEQTTESQGIVPLPSYLTIAPSGKATVAPGALVRSTGTLSLNGPPGVRKIRIQLIS